MAEDLFGEAPAQRAKGIGPQGGKHYVKPWGYFMPPGTGPSGETCKTCKHLTGRGGVAGRYLKCERARSKWTHGRKTDILAGSPACSGWEKPDQLSPNEARPDGRQATALALGIPSSDQPGAI